MKNISDYVLVPVRTKTCRGCCFNDNGNCVFEDTFPEEEMYCSHREIYAEKYLVEEIEKYVEYIGNHCAETRSEKNNYTSELINHIFENDIGIYNIDSDDLGRYGNFHKHPSITQFDGEVSRMCWSANVGTKKYVWVSIWTELGKSISCIYYLFEVVEHNIVADESELTGSD